MNMKDNHAEFEPIRGSVTILVIKLFLILFFIDVAHSLLSIFLFDLPLLKGVHYQLVTVMFFTHTIKNIIEIYFVIWIVLNWISSVYYLTEKNIIKRTGIFQTNEQIYDLKKIRSVEVNQGFIGKLLNYGDITIQTSASGGYQHEIYLTGIANPEKYREIFKHCLEITT